MMEYSELPAPPPIDALVHCFWFLRGESNGPDVQTIVADGRIEIVLHLADPFLKLDERGQAQRQDATLVSGQLMAPIRVIPGGSADVVGIRFRTAAASVVLHLPLAEITDRVEALALCAPRLSDALFDAAAQHRQPAHRVAALSAVLARFVARAPDPLALAAVRMLEAPSAPRVAQAAGAFGVSTRTLERRVLDHSGLTPSALRRVLRFRRAFRMLDQSPEGTWSTVAANAGYFDQAHLIRDFRQFAGSPPGDFFQRDPDLARAILGSATNG
jgi:AraC-like DNA-binding protein